MGQEIVPDEETQEYPIVYGPLDRPLEGQAFNPQFFGQIFLQNIQPVINGKN